MRGKIVHPAEAHFLHLLQPVPHPPARVGGMNAADHGHFLDDRKHFIFADLHGNGVGIAIGHEAAGRAVAAHAEPAGVVNDDEIGAAFLDELRRDAGAGAGRDNGLAPFEGGAESLNDFFARVRVTFSSPGIRHDSFS